MACQCDKDAIVAASVELFHAVMASFYNKEIQASGSDGWWSDAGYTGTRYEASGSTTVFSYSNGTITAAITYNLETTSTS